MSLVINIKDVSNESRLLSRKQFYRTGTNVAFRPSYAWEDTPENRKLNFDPELAFNLQDKPKKSMKWERVFSENLPGISIKELKWCLDYVNQNFLDEKEQIDHSGFEKESEFFQILKALDTKERKLRIII